MQRVMPIIVLLAVATVLLGSVTSVGWVYSEFVAPAQVKMAYDEIPQAVREDPQAALTYNAQENVVEVVLDSYKTIEEISQQGHTTIRTTDANRTFQLLLVAVIVFMLMGGLNKLKGGSDAGRQNAPA